MVIILQVELLLQCQMSREALVLAEHAVRLAPTLMRPWILLARAQVSTNANG